MKNKILKNGVKILVFACIASLLGAVIQSVLRYKWEKAEYMSARYHVIEEMSDGNMDVLYLGSSPLYAGINPTIIWNTQGFTGFNFGVSMQEAMLTYYQLQYILQYQTPKVVCLDLSSISTDRSPDSLSYEAVFRKMVETMPDLSLKNSMILDICRLYENQSYFSYWIPLVRYHDRWNELDQWDFDSSLYERWYIPFNHGSMVRTDYTPQEWPEDYLCGDVDLSQMGGYQEEYYDKIIQLCKENGIEVAVIIPPRLSLDTVKYEYAKYYCAQRGLLFIAFTTPEQWDLIGLDSSVDFYDNGHLNVTGQYKYSVAIGELLKANFNLEDKRDDPSYSQWNSDYSEYFETYGSYLSNII